VKTPLRFDVAFGDHRSLQRVTLATGGRDELCKSIQGVSGLQHVY
jgi:hypothetical protein